MEIIYVPGKGHEELLLLSSEEIACIFAPGTQLSETFPVINTVHAQMIRKESSGNGAWIMQKCAEALDGKCEIRFETERTVFTFSCPVDKTITEKETAGAGSIEDEFYLPETTWGIVIDDSMIQRKLLDRFSKMAGFDKSRRRILGEKADEVFSFPDIVMDLMKSNPDDKFLVIVDDNLDILDGGARHQTVSGSKCVETMRQKLDPSTEKRMLALIRSANDSASDPATYKSRAHGYLFKEPVKKGRVLDVIRPWWRDRFPTDSIENAADIESSSDDESYGPSTDDLRESLNVIDGLCSTQTIDVLKQRWCIIREKLHALKGDVKTLLKSSKRDTQAITERINQLRSNEKELPQDFLEQWSRLRSEIEHLL